MRYVRVKAVDDSWGGYSLDPDSYLDVLPEIAIHLPEGARAFALDEEHYNFFGRKCVKDLQVDRVNLVDANDRVDLEIVFAPNSYKHNSGLVIRYSDVMSLAVDITSNPRVKNVWPETRRLGDFQLDEILPHEKGCSHEIQMTGGTIRIVSADLRARWGEAASNGDCPPDDGVVGDSGLPSHY